MSHWLRGYLHGLGGGPVSKSPLGDHGPRDQVVGYPNLRDGQSDLDGPSRDLILDLDLSDVEGHGHDLDPSSDHDLMHDPGPCLDLYHDPPSGHAHATVRGSDCGDGKDHDHRGKVDDRDRGLLPNLRDHDLACLLGAYGHHLEVDLPGRPKMRI